MNLSLLRFTFFLLFITIVFSCTKITTSDIGSGLIPLVDGVITKDTTLDVVTKNAGYDTISVGISDNHVLGFVNDNIFGKTTASINFQISPTVLPLSWGIDKSNIVLDSVVLCLKYQSTWGDTSLPIRLHVYSMDNENLFRSDSAYPDTKIFEKATELTEFHTAKTVYPYTLNDVDTTAHYGEVATSQIRIKLDNSFGQKLIDFDSASVYQTDSTFYNNLRGIIVEPEQASGNGLMLVSLTDTSTHLSLYYHSKDLADTLTRRFQPNSLTAASSNTILRNYQGTQIPSYISSASTNDDLIFMQTSPGIYAKIKTPGIDLLSNRIVHRAELLMYEAPVASVDTLLTPPNLFVAALNPDSNRRFAVPNDITFSGTSISNLTQFGVVPLRRSDPNTGLPQHYYSFDLTRYVQGIITKKEKLYDLVLYAPYNQYIYSSDTSAALAVPIATPALNTAGVGRVRLGGGSNAQYKMRLHIVYSNIN